VDARTVGLLRTALVERGRIEENRIDRPPAGERT
jgi:hypothetical protein